MGNIPEHYECKLTESDFLPSIGFEKFQVGTWVPGDHGDHGTSVSDEIDQKKKLVRTLGFSLDFFLSSFQPLEAEIGCLCT